MTGPLTGKTVNARLGSGRRLKTIYSVNMRGACHKGQYERTMAGDIHSYLMYRTGSGPHHREEHKSRDGLILPKDDPVWDSHFPPNGWGCKCYTRALTGAREKQYEENSIPAAPKPDGSGGGGIPVKTRALPVKYKTYFNERKGTFEQVPEGTDPAFNWNQGRAGNKAALQKRAEAKQNYEKAAAAKPEKEYLTKKKPAGDTAAIDARIKGAPDKQAAAGLEAEKAECRRLPDKKSRTAEKKKLIRTRAAPGKKFHRLRVKTYRGIRKDDAAAAGRAYRSGGHTG